MTIEDLKQQFASNAISKPNFIESAYSSFHQVLFQYAEALKHTDIKEITVDGSGVIFTIRSSGVKIRCQPGDHRSPPIETFNFNDFEPAESRMMHKLFDDCHVFYDIGANIGWHSLNLCAKSRKTRFYCFEPIPKTFEQLNDNILLNSADRITTFNIALSDEQGEQKFYYYTACSGNASAANLSERADVSELICRKTTLDLFSSENSLPPPDFIKCDVEGAELIVFKGGINTISAHQPIIMAEILRKWSAKFNYNPNEIFDLLNHIGYEAFTTDGDNLLDFNQMTESTVETNFFFLHNKKHSQLIRRFKQQ